MKYALSLLVSAVCFQSTVYATPLREAAPSLLEAAPDQEAFYETMEPQAKGDDEERAEQDAERQTKISELKAEYEAGGSEIKRATALFELIGLYQTRSFYLRDKAVKAYAAEMDKFWIGEVIATPELKLGPAKEELLRRVNALRDMLGNFANDPRRDELNWMIASTMARVGNDHCDFYFKQAIEHAKAQEWIQKARISQADYLVSKGKLDDAQKIYDDVRQKATDDVKAYATYRLGWVYLAKGLQAPPKDRAGLLKRAEAALKLVVVMRKDKDEESRFQLKPEAAYDLAWLWAVNGDEKEATAFFAKYEMPKMLDTFKEKLAAEAVAQRKFDKAATLYRGFIAKAPTDPRVPDLHLRLAQAFIVAGDAKGLQQETDAMERLASKEDDPWFDEHKDDAVLVERVKKMRTLLPLTAGLQLFKSAQAEKNDKRKKELLDGATTQLAAYLKNPPAGAQVHVLRATLTSAYEMAGRYTEALDQMDIIVKLGPKAGDMLPNVAFERLNVLVKLDSEAKYPPVPAPGEVKSPMPLPALKTRFAAAADDYLKIVPKAEIEPNLRFQVTQDLFTYGHYDEALKRFEQLVNDFPRTDQGKRAIELILSLQLKRENWDELVRLSTAFLNNREVKGKALREYIKQNLDYAKQRKA